MSLLKVVFAYISLPTCIARINLWINTAQTTGGDRVGWRAFYATYDVISTRAWKHVSGFFYVLRWVVVFYIFAG